VDTYYLDPASQAASFAADGADPPYDVAAGAAEFAGCAAGRDGEIGQQAHFIRDIVGPLPFRPVTIDPAWLASNFATVPAVARHIYDDRAFHDLPILADALEDAGCTNAAILVACQGRFDELRVLSLRRHFSLLDLSGSSPPA
jgi:hypothetical protein